MRRRHPQSRSFETLLEEAPDRDPILDRVCPTIGLSDEVVPTEETFWGVRKFLEAVATKPLIVVIDDLQWAEPTLDHRSRGRLVA